MHYYANSTSYTKAKLITASNYVVGGIYSQTVGHRAAISACTRENAGARTPNWPNCATGCDGIWLSLHGARFRCPEPPPTPPR